MKLFLDIVFLIIIAYLSIQFVYVLIKMKQQIIYPVTNEELSSIRIHPEKPVDAPTYSKHKLGITFYSAMILFVLIVYFLGLYFDIFNFSFYILLILPFTYLHNVLNVFALTKDGILIGVRFIAWNKIKSFDFIPIDINHKYYGFSKEANNGYELKVRSNGMPISCIITSEKMKENLTNQVNEYVK
ncbi:hypothetical protein [Pseudogracilibacillus sp. SO30301A]|uniref:hypothetical protein n=1 Tax=Pseudogracilibacillus sp. SO30301A TaxID=3098291 RepID=UPI00300E689D